MPIDVHIKKPVYGTYVYIRDVYVDAAIKQRTKLRITIPQGVALVDPREWKKNAHIMYKAFKRPDHPMKLYGGNVPIAMESKGVVVPAEDRVLQDSLF